MIEAGKTPSLIAIFYHGILDERGARARLVRVGLSQMTRFKMRGNCRLKLKSPNSSSFVLPNIKFINMAISVNAAKTGSIKSADETTTDQKPNEMDHLMIDQICQIYDRRSSLVETS